MHASWHLLFWLLFYFPFNQLSSALSEKLRNQEPPGAKAARAELLVHLLIYVIGALIFLLVPPT